MPATLLPPRLLRHSLLALLVLGLLLQAQAGVLRQLLGAAHWHQPVVLQATAAAHAGWLDRLQAWRRDLLARSLLIAGHGRSAVHDDGDGHHHAAAASHAWPAAAPAAHHHDGVARHHHTSQDASVVTPERPAGDGDPLSDGQIGSLLQPLALDAGWRGALPVPGPAAWPGGRVPHWRDAARRLAERPPRA
jgi:hypothetical protein